MKIIHCPLNLTPAQAHFLQQLQQRFAQACNAVADIAHRHQVIARVALHHLAYETVRDRFPDLGAQLACNAIYAVARGYRQAQKVKSALGLPGDVLPILRFSSSAPVEADRYHLYRSHDELGKTFTMVGYGDIGTGTTGEMSQSTPYRHDAQNTFDTTATQLKNALGSAMAWTPHGDMTLVADFDDGSLAHDALGRLMGLYNTGLGAAEGLIAPGDSGGPAFINGQIAGVASYGASLAKAGVSPDVTPYRTDASFGEIAAWTRISNEQQFIDQALRQTWTDAPHTPAQVKTVISEGNAGQITTAWFLVNYSGTVTADQPVEVKYKTLDGTAKAGQDYIATQGTLVFYPGEQAVPIPVEIIGDNIPESNETFYLEIYDPIGGTFPNGATELIGMRTIVDDDLLA